VLHGQFDRLALARVEDFDVFATHFEVRAAVVHESRHERQAAGVDEVAVVVQDVHVGAHVEALLAGDDAEGFGVEGAGAADGLFQDAGEEDFGLVLSGDVELALTVGMFERLSCLVLCLIFILPTFRLQMQEMRWARVLLKW